MQVFKTLRTVVAYDIDHHNHVNNIRYLEWIQTLAATQGNRYPQQYSAK